MLEPNSLPLSVLDQSFVRAGDGAQVALAETLQIAGLCEALGYRRFWVSEHHDTTILAGSSPEVLLAAIGAATRTIRIGSGGIMLPHYSPYKVAENFSLLANLYPGRVDLGVGRAPGADMDTAIALATDGRPKFERFPELVEQLGHYLWAGNTKPRVSPAPPRDLPIWMLGSSPDSAALAADTGLPYNVALFINPQADPGMIALYRQRFQSSALWPEPHAMITVTALCADTEERALALKKAADVNYITFVTRGPHIDYIDPEQAREYEFNPQELAFLARYEHSRAIGTQEQVRAKIEALARYHDANEVMLVSNSYHLADRIRSFQLVAEAFGLEKPTVN
ncbi:MAG: LLM class flavin-dependent oxidoreductase [Gammaproteobacteria bacterium]|nr:LLM class flavin-dependent oxidoreductase [Gammaproteobacteria bacterium]